MKTDIEIARECKLSNIQEIASKIDIPLDKLEMYGKYIAKVPETLIDEKKVEKSNLILVTAITPTKAGIGKTTVSIGLALGLSKLGKKTVCALREPSLGPCFGVKGGAAGGGHAQVLPMEKINLHFTGDFHAITSAHNMIAALLDNYIYQHREEGFALKEVLWKRVLDINDRNLRTVVTGLGAKTDGIPAESGFDITPASEIMAVLCLSKNLDDLRRRIGNIIVGIKVDDTPFRVKDMGVDGAITVLLMDAIHPNLVQTTEQTPAFVHGGDFRQHSAWMQYHHSHTHGNDIRRLCGDRGRLRSRPRSREVLQHQMPQERTDPQAHHHRGNDTGTENAWRRAYRTHQRA